MFIYVLISSLIVSIVSFVGILFLVMNESVLDRVTFLLVAFAAGAMLGGAFFHIIPENLEAGMASLEMGVLLLTGFSLFFVLEKSLRLHHCHDPKCDKHHIGYLNLFGDGLHNFLDGILIAAAYLASVSVGIAMTLAVIAHEIPQEFGDFGVLIYSGFSKGRALFYNFLSAFAAVLGAILGWYVLRDTGFVNIVLPFLAGSLIYMATTDLIPELHKEGNLVKSIFAFLSFILGLIVLYMMKIWIL